MFALAVQTKQFAIFLLPWLLFELWRGRAGHSRGKATAGLLLGLLLGFVPFLGYYLQRPDLLAIPIYTTAGLASPSNFFNFIGTLGHSSNQRLLLLSFWYSALTLLGLAVLARHFLATKNRSVEALFSLLPLASFLVLLQSVSVARLWYPIVSPGFLHCFAQHRTVICAYLAIYLVQGMPIAVALISGNHSLIWGHTERQAMLDIMKDCMFLCHPK